MREMVTVERMVFEAFSDRRWVRCAVGIRGEYMVRCRRVLSLMRSRLEDSGGSCHRDNSR